MKFYWVSRVGKYLTKPSRIKLVEGILNSQINYGLEITTGGSDRENTIL